MPDGHPSDAVHDRIPDGLKYRVTIEQAALQIEIQYDPDYQLCSAGGHLTRTIVRRGRQVTVLSAPVAAIASAGDPHRARARGPSVPPRRWRDESQFNPRKPER